jgi:hypothetical protein
MRLRSLTKILNHENNNDKDPWIYGLYRGCAVDTSKHVIDKKFNPFIIRKILELYKQSEATVKVKSSQ